MTIDTRYEDAVFRQSLRQRTNITRTKFKPKHKFIIEKKLNDEWIVFLLSFSEKEANNFRNKTNYRIR